MTDVAAWNWYFGWYYDKFDKYVTWYDNLHKQHPEIKGGLSEYGAEGCISQQQEDPNRPNPTAGFSPNNTSAFTMRRSGGT